MKESTDAPMEPNTEARTRQNDKVSHTAEGKDRLPNGIFKNYKILYWQSSKNEYTDSNVNSSTFSEKHFVNMNEAPLLT